MDYSLEPWYAGECSNCSRVLRKSGYKKNDISVAHKGYGLCPKCYWDSRSTGTIPYRPLIEINSTTIECSKCHRSFSPDRMKHKAQKPTRVCKVCSKLFERYKITYLDYLKMLEECEYRCLICEDSVEGAEESGKVKAVVDHDHKTGKVRGTLCSSCNLGLGFLRVDFKVDRVQNYLRTRISVPTNKCYCAECRTRREGTGLSCIQINYLRSVSDNGCYLCDMKFVGSPYVDHDHNCCPKTRKYTCYSCIRGVLCRGCNSSLGLFKEDAEILKRALKYLEEAK